ncbi:phosphoribosylglycinamide formyltransferase [Allorhodopirellula solitaria]|uniref:Phosphoribosylglycinamide formyltransferase n=1 Tax=Allorhodopirellula solitaria TaxID=2527987 RepID=A0A5C5XP30_9BACT|nr:phosphoribosylglycinamide formyltransferase [Allorhodopirellula solitaria]TWT64664.1 Phosphoribosylglycinamide formyltransferase [Allorhodopirellula solitaria]
MSASSRSQTIPIAVFLSGSGRTLANLIEHRDQHGLPIDIRIVISSRSDVRGVEIARQAGIETQIIRQRDYPDANGYSAAMFAPLGELGIEYVVMAGFLKHVLIPHAFENRVLNIHPSLLPAFGGQGMYGSRVHAAVIERGVKITGCTVHFVDNEYDNGPIVHQRSCPVLADDTPDSLAARVFEQECLALPEAIEMIALT